MDSSFLWLQFYHGQSQFCMQFVGPTVYACVLFFFFFYSVGKDRDIFNVYEIISLV